MTKGMSPKDSEQMRRSDGEATSMVPIDLSSICVATPLTKEAKRFWYSTQHNDLLQKFLYTHLKDKMAADICTIVLAQVTEDGEYSCISLQEEVGLEYMENHFE